MTKRLTKNKDKPVEVILGKTYWTDTAFNSVIHSRSVNELDEVAAQLIDKIATLESPEYAKSLSATNNSANSFVSSSSFGIRARVKGLKNKLTAIQNRAKKLYKNRTVKTLAKEENKANAALAQLLVKYVGIAQRAQYVDIRANHAKKRAGEDIHIKTKQDERIDTVQALIKLIEPSVNRGEPIPQEALEKYPELADYFAEQLQAAQFDSTEDVLNHSNATEEHSQQAIQEEQEESYVEDFEALEAPEEEQITVTKDADGVYHTHVPDKLHPATHANDLLNKLSSLQQELNLAE